MAVFFTTVEEYIALYPEMVQARLQAIRRQIIQDAPNATEGIAYKMPAYKVKGKPLVYFAAYKNHIGFYATPVGHTQFAAELSCYKQGKGSVQFPHDLPLPLDLISRIVQFRASM